MAKLFWGWATNGLATSLLLLLVIVAPVFAQTAPTFAPVPSDPNAPIKDPGQVTNLVNEILFWLSTIFWIAAVGFVFYAAYLHLTAGGSPERIKQAQKQLLYAVIAIAIGLMAQGLPALIKAFLALGGGGGGGSGAGSGGGGGGGGCLPGYTCP